MSSAGPQVRATLRTVLRELGKQGQQASARNQKDRQWQRFVLASYRRHANETDPERVQQLRRDAEDYATLLQNVRLHHELLQRYNSSLTDKERLELSARRVGLGLPKAFMGDEEEDAVATTADAGNSQKPQNPQTSA